MDITVLVPAGRLPLTLMAQVHEIASKNNLAIYLSTAQNLRILDVPEDLVEPIKKELIALGASLKAPGKFPLPRVCIGQGHCKLGVIDTSKVSARIVDAFKDKEKTKAKFKIAVSACGMGCASHKTTDIGIVASRKGFDVFAGGKGGTAPKVGRRILRDINEDEVLAAVKVLVDFHDLHTSKKQRMYKLLTHEDFPYPDEV